MRMTTTRNFLCVILVVTFALILPLVWGAIGTPFRFTNVTKLEDGNIQVTYAGPPLGNYRLWASEDINARPIYTTWTLLTNSPMPAGGSATFADTQATNYPQRFYIITSP